MCTVHRAVVCVCACTVTGKHRWSVVSSDAEAGSRDMMCPICREVMKPSDAQTHLILEFSQLKQLVNTYVPAAQNPFTDVDPAV